MTPTNYKEALDWAFLLLQEANCDPEAAEYVLLERQDWRKTDLLLNERQPIPSKVWQQLQQDVAQLATGLPAQYLLGYAWFDGLKLSVDSATLIPRQETEELVSWISECYPAAARLRFLDIGTGSGAIALALQRRFPQSTVVATDISSEALKVASKNATALQLPLTFYQGDLWQALPKDEPLFDVIVSNPPYIAADEKKVMDYSVLNFEPQTALFADHQGLAIYERLAANVAHYLQPKGNLFMEFGYQQAVAIQSIFQTTLPNHQVEIRRDMANWPRMARVY
ncbi:peptide chain release factor N(5)-glutamine methyltransferase [Lapidilactobacillus bayanensis]|uniref:peptide chain release factor N(5)-glutamine methyltransferase n=1 Tax=Lapidilactobacillus bayanensis TaxID=2485998 RepID=UPI000F77485F|nr:peptide chain release factor N(5)-glutamine methyltransferase [Lapidilactobacillus bayanensis]